MKKIIFTLLVLCTFAIQNVMASCPAGEIYVELHAANDGDYIGDPTTITVTIGGNVVYAGNPAVVPLAPLSPDGDFVIVSGCFPEGASITIEYVDGFGDGILVSPPVQGIIGCQFLSDVFTVNDADGVGGFIIGLGNNLPSDNDGTDGVRDPAAAGDGCGLAAGNAGVMVAATAADAATAQTDGIGQTFGETTLYDVCDVAGGQDADPAVNAESEFYEVCGDFTMPNATGNESGVHVSVFIAGIELELGTTDYTDVDGNGGINDCGGQLVDISIFDQGCGGAAVASGATTLTGLTPGNSYTICVTARTTNTDTNGPDGVSGTADDGTTPADGTCVLDGISIGVQPFNSVCVDFNSISAFADCNILQICIGYTLASGEDPTGMTMTVSVPAGGTALNDGIFQFDASGDGNSDAVGYCFTYQFDEQGCDPIPYSAIVNVTCPDGSPAFLDVGQPGAPTSLTNADVICDVFGVCGGGAFYPVLTFNDLTGVGGCGDTPSWNVTSPDGTVCDSDAGDPANAPICPATSTMTSLAFDVEINPLADPLLSALFGAGTFRCGIDVDGTLTATCNDPCVPVELLYFEGQVTGLTNTLTWASATELDTEWHAVERSFNGKDSWEEVGRVAAAGNSFNTIAYELIDAKPLTLGYYRLATINLDGSIDLSEVIIVNRKEGDKGITKVTPVPTNDFVTVQYETAIEGNVQFYVTDILGKVVTNIATEASKGLNTQEIDLSNLTTGIYYVTFDNGVTRSVRRVVKQ